jgi:hypothetical protein
VVKRVFNILLNAENENSAKGAIREYLQENCLKILNRIPILIAAIKRAHAPIAHHLHSGIGLKLQYRNALLVQEIFL